MRASMSWECGPCPMPQTAAPAKPAPSSTRSSKCETGTILTFGGAVDVDELCEDILDAVVLHPLPDVPLVRPCYGLLVGAVRSRASL